MWQKIVDNLDRIFQAFNVEVVEHENRYSGPCFLHGGDNTTAFTIYKDSGAWRCFTCGCHEIYGSNVVGLIRLLLQKKYAREISSTEAIQFLEKFFNGKLDRDFSPDINRYFLQKNAGNYKLVPREKVRKELEIPAEYFLDRGFSAEVLDKYDVGLCTNKNKMFYKRCVAPIYDHEYNGMLGCTGRDTTNKSKTKWLHSQGLDRSNVLYNSWFAKKHIEKTNTAIIVESPGNIWRLEEADIHCGIALFGTSISFGQMRLLSKMGTLNIVLMLDNDEAGKIATGRIAKQLKGLYNIVIPKISYEDVGECPKDYLIEKITPILKEL